MLAVAGERTEDPRIRFLAHKSRRLSPLPRRHAPYGRRQDNDQGPQTHRGEAREQTCRTLTHVWQEDVRSARSATGPADADVLYLCLLAIPLLCTFSPVDS